MQVLIRISGGRDPDLEIMDHLFISVDMDAKVDVDLGQSLDLDLTVKFLVKIPMNY